MYHFQFVLLFDVFTISPKHNPIVAQHSICVGFQSNFKNSCLFLINSTAPSSIEDADNQNLAQIAIRDENSVELEENRFENQHVEFIVDDDDEKTFPQPISSRLNNKNKLDLKLKTRSNKTINRNLNTIGRVRKNISKKIAQSKLPSKKNTTKTISTLLARLNDKELRDLHTNAFDIPRRIVSKLKKGCDEWNEDDVDVENINPSLKQSKNSKQTATVTTPAATKSATATTTNSAAILGLNGNCFRSNLLKIDYAGKKRDSAFAFSNSIENDMDQPASKKQKENENDLSENVLEQTSTGSLRSHVNLEDSNWKAKSSYTELLYTYFTFQSQTESSASKESSHLNDTQQTFIKKKNLKYKCNICEENGCKLGSRATGVVTCQYGNNSNMKRHIETVSQIEVI